MSIQNPKTVRSALASAIQTAMIGTGLPLQAVYGYYPKDLGGLSPVCTIESLPRAFNLKTATNFQTYEYAVTFWASTDGETGSGATAADAEDALDDCYYALTRLLLDQYKAEYFQASVPIQFEQESGNIYQTEMHYVRISRP